MAAGTIHIWTDGSTGKQHGPGGYGAVILATVRGKQHQREVSGGEAATTSPRMELRAALEGINALKGGAHKIEVHSDSQYLVQGMSGGKMHTRYNLGTLKMAANYDLWEQLIQADQFHKITWTKVKSQSTGDKHYPGREYNVRADQLAKKARDHISTALKEGDSVNIEDGEIVVNFTQAQREVKAAGEGWPKECIESENTIGFYAARLYPLLNGPVEADGRPGVLLQAFEDHCMILFDDSEETIAYRGGKARKAAEFVNTRSVKPVGMGET